jgi:GTP pyrophosphokinase
MNSHKTITDILKVVSHKKKYTHDPDLIRKAYEYAHSKHLHQKRKSGEPYIIHPLEAAYTIAELDLDDTSIIAALLHDVLEDTPTTYEEIAKEFGSHVAEIIEGVTKLGKLKFVDKQQEYQAENLRKMFIAMTKDLRVIIVKLADRLHNMRTLKHLPPEKRIQKARETLEIYAPIASRLGMGNIRGELEDLAFPWVHPQDYEILSKQTHVLFKEGEKLLAIEKRKLEDHLRAEQIPSTIEGRKKHLYSLWKKLQRPELNGDITKVPDIVALRVIVEEDSIEKCYAVLGIVHAIWKPVPRRVSDYIAVPKTNGYRSLHTKVFLENGRMMEVQIRTRKMHEEAEFGIASHIIYEQHKSKQGITDSEVEKGFQVTQSQTEWIRQLTAWQRETKDDSIFMRGLTHDLFNDRIFVFTPQGDIKDLPRGATPVDFAYAIHTQIGNNTTGARVNGQLVPLSYQLKNSEIVEIITSKENKLPSHDWLNFVTTNHARKQIMKAIGLTEEPKTERLEPKNNPDSPKKIRLQNLPDLLLPSRALSAPLSLLDKVQSAFIKRPKQPQKEPHVVVQQMTGVKTRIARCCNPLPGEEIIGFVTRDQTIAIHTKNCVNAAHQLSSHKPIPVSWSDDIAGFRPMRFQITMQQRPNALRDITQILSDTKVEVTQLEQLPTKDNTLKIQFITNIQEEQKAKEIRKRLQKIAGIYEIS